MMPSSLTIIIGTTLMLSISQIVHSQSNFGGFNFGGMGGAGFPGMGGAMSAMGGGFGGGHMGAEWLMDDPFKADRMPVWNQLMRGRNQGGIRNNNPAYNYQGGASSGQQATPTYSAPAQATPSYNIPNQSNSQTSLLWRLLLAQNMFGSQQQPINFDY